MLNGLSVEKVDSAGIKTSLQVQKSLDISQMIDSLVEYYSGIFVSAHGPEEDLEGLHPFVIGFVEDKLIEKVLEKCQGSKIRASHVLGLHRNTLSQKLSQRDYLKEKAQKIKKQKKVSRLRGLNA